jgi:hypothetical protein
VAGAIIGDAWRNEQEYDRLCRLEFVRDAAHVLLRMKAATAQWV